MSIRIAHANYRIREVQPTVDFWRQLGLEVVGNLQIADGYCLLYLGASGDDQTTIELAYRETPGESYDFSPGAGHIALAVGNLDELVGKLESNGVPVSIAPFNPVPGNSLRVAFVIDPNGMKVELIEGTFPTPRDPLPDMLR
ncbi:VOC family protein [Caballeronia novacaledonica]|uniref:Aldoketomutase n=1 Tax=Caballeronia novacaledonica TaxID=1544861 RepID=A0AA37MJ11_9BURK|nr:VOC family protein [Caballeronia novacaledonica]GJH29370.1 VOC family protein [Caballeronia novacaledonica]